MVRPVHVMELSPESGIVDPSDEAFASSRDGHDHEQATPDVRAPSRSWSLVCLGCLLAKANGPGLRPGHCIRLT
jgi:hypothetical protein